MSLLFLTILCALHNGEHRVRHMLFTLYVDKRDVRLVYVLDTIAEAYCVVRTDIMANPHAIGRKGHKSGQRNCASGIHILKTHTHTHTHTHSLTQTHTLSPSLTHTRERKQTKKERSGGCAPICSGCKEEGAGRRNHEQGKGERGNGLEHRHMSERHQPTKHKKTTKHKNTKEVKTTK